MPKKIFKYALGMDMTQTVELPAGAQILSTKIQNGYINLWALVDPDAEVEQRTIVIVGTGWEIPEQPLTFIETVLDGAFVWHVFELLK